jgi:hypothetical protein
MGHAVVGRRQLVGADGESHRYVTSGVGLLIAGVRVPQGAQIVSVTLEACDSSDVGTVTFTLYRFDPEGGSGSPLATIETGGPFNGGCDRFLVELPVPETVHNGLYRYLLEGGNDTIDGSTTVGAVRVWYRLQVTPPPFGATFNDVPASDPAFQYVEALYSSGITSGCGNGSYCPDTPLTRRQMAVFLAKALGLYWPEYPNPN